MAKQEHKVRQTNINGGNGHAQAIEQHITYDDNFLPDAGELQKYQSVNPDLVVWIMERTAIEQDARINTVNRKLDFNEKSSTKQFIINLLGIICALIVISMGMSFSYFLLVNNNQIMGSCFAGGTLLVAVNSFLKYGKQQSSSDKQNKENK
jgi:uncharacterized membrane protein